jgi:methyltransferase (TIGR00027 family)
MQSRKPSETSFRSATHRAVHQVLDHGAIFTDPLALRIIGTNAETVLRDAHLYTAGNRLRWFIAMRARVAEDALAAAASARGITQLVVLGAGLDTYAYRGALAQNVHIFEVDHPATQAWKRELLAKAGIEPPKTLTFVPVDFERETLTGALAAAGLDPAQRTFFTWLGVLVYLTKEAILSTLRYVASLPGGADIVFDYSNPTGSLSGDDAAAREAITTRVASMGEDFRSHFDTDELCAELGALGFRTIRDLGPPELAKRFLADSNDAPYSGVHVLHAATT